MTVGPDCANAVDHSVEDFAHAYGQRTSLYDAFIEWQGLLRVKRFLRSTFSQVLAVHREMHSSTGAGNGCGRTGFSSYCNPVSPAWVRQDVYLDISGFTS